MWKLVCVAVATIAAGCAGGASTGGLLPDAEKTPFFEAARTRVAGWKKEVTATGSLQQPRAGNGQARAYSGAPDGISLRTIYERGGIIDVPRAQAYMHEVMDKLLRQWPFDVARVGIFVVNQQAFDAQSTAGGDILISAGMLAQMDSEDELAAVLAHELAHILLNHHERAKQVADNKKALNGAASLAVTYLMFSNTDWVKTGKGSYQGTFNTGSWMSQSLQAGGACLAATYMIDKFVDPGWSRAQEDEADLLGIDLMIKAGYSPNAALQAMRRRIEYEGDTKKTIVERRREAGEYDKMTNDAVKQGGVGGIFTGAARTIAAGVIDTVSDIDNEITQRHRMSSARLASMQVYLDRHYPLRERKPLISTPYAAAIKSRDMLKVIEHHRLAYEATKAKDLPTALELAQRSTAPPTGGAVAPRMAMYMVLSAMNRNDDAFNQLLHVKHLDNAPPQFFHALADGYARRGQAQAAEDMRQRAVARAKSMFDEEEKGASATFLSRLLAPSSGAGADRYNVQGYCEALRAGVSGGASAIAGRQL